MSNQSWRTGDRAGAAICAAYVVAMGTVGCGDDAKPDVLLTTASALIALGIREE